MIILVKLALLFSLNSFADSRVVFTAGNSIGNSNQKISNVQQSQKFSDIELEFVPDERTSWGLEYIKNMETQSNRQFSDYSMLGIYLRWYYYTPIPQVLEAQSKRKSFITQVDVSPFIGIGTGIMSGEFNNSQKKIFTEPYTTIKLGFDIPCYKSLGFIANGFYSQAFMSADAISVSGFNLGLFYFF